MPADDLVTALVHPVRLRLEAVLAPHLPADLATAVGALVDAGAVALVGVTLARAGRALASAEPRAKPSPVRGVAAMTGAVAAIALFLWILRHPSTHFHELFARGDHLAAALLLGLLIVRAEPGWRSWLVTALSAFWLLEYSGTLATAVSVGAALIGFAALALPALRRGWPAVALHAGIAIVVYGLCWQIRRDDVLAALRVYGLYSFVFLRQISFAIAAAEGRAGGVGSYLCYLLFYPGATGALGAPEVWSEFARRNLGTRTNADYEWASRQVVRGVAQLWLADRIPVSAEIAFASPTTVLAWVNSLALFVQVALRGMGYWAMVDATASFYGFRLRQNFVGILRARNPSEFWRSWRGTLTNWLVCHVYAPLGANRRHQSRNIAAAFAVSLVWHWGGVPFLSGDFRVGYLAPITLWAVVNALAVIAHTQATHRHWALLPDATPSAARVAIHRVLTMCLGSLSVTLPYMQLGAQHAFLPFVGRLIGVGP